MIEQMQQAQQENPFNGIESQSPRYGVPAWIPHVNPFNGIESHYGGRSLTPPP